MEELPIQLPGRQRYFLHGAQTHKCKASKEGDRAALSTSQDGAAGGCHTQTQALFSPLPQPQTGVGGRSWTLKQVTEAHTGAGLGWAGWQGSEDSALTLPLNIIWLQMALGFFHTTPPKGQSTFTTLKIIKGKYEQVLFLVQPRLREVLTSTHKTEQGHYPK